MEACDDEISARRVFAQLADETPFCESVDDKIKFRASKSFSCSLIALPTCTFFSDSSPFLARKLMQQFVWK